VNACKTANDGKDARVQDEPPLVAILKPPSHLTRAELGEFEKLIREGGQVEGRGLKELIAEALVLAFVKSGGAMIAVGALKKPRARYTQKIAKASDYPELTVFKAELGWMHTIPAHQGKGHARRICQALTSICSDGMFATTNTENGGMRHLLETAGFVEVGKPYRSSLHSEELLSVWVREARADITHGN
jgi:GNAT superfamily N-acetyltransferase